MNIADVLDVMEGWQFSGQSRSTQKSLQPRFSAVKFSVLAVGRCGTAAQRHGQRSGQATVPVGPLSCHSSCTVTFSFLIGRGVLGDFEGEPSMNRKANP